MIYSDINRLREDFDWFVDKSIVATKFFSKLSNNEIKELEEELIQYEQRDIESFYVNVLDKFGFEDVKIENSFYDEFLPVVAFDKNIGLSIIIEKVDQHYKIENKDGIKYIKEFSKNTKYIALKSKEKVYKKQSAIELFKNVAKEQKSLITYAAIATFGINILALGSSLYTMQVYDRVVSSGAMSTLIALYIGVSIAIFLEMLLKFAKSTILDYNMKVMDVKFSNDIFRRFLQIRLDNLPKSVGSLSGQLQSYSSVRAFIATTALFIVIDFPFSFVFLAAISFIAGIEIGVVVLIFLILSIIVGLFFKNKIEQISKQSSMASYKKMGMLVEAIENSEKIKSTNARWDFTKKWNTLTHEAIDDDVLMKHYSDMSSYITTFLQQISYITIVAYGAYLVSTEGSITMGALIATTILSNRILSPIGQLPGIFVQLGRTKLSVGDLNNLYSLAQDNEGVTKPLYPYFENVDLRCENIQFGYTEGSVALKVQRLEIKQGEKVAILGVIGSGKSTLLKILSGIYKVNSGNVYLNNIDIQQISRDSLSDNIAYLPQTSKLISGTIRDNITMGLFNISDQDILQAAKETGLIKLLNKLPQGLDTVVPEGGESVSGGQKQLIALTNIALANKNIWLLDEPTSSMDEGSEKMIISMLQNKLTSKQTLVVVTHKPIVLNAVERIIILSEQGVVIDGEKNEVLAKINPANIQRMRQ